MGSSQALSWSVHVNPCSLCGVCQNPCDIPLRKSTFVQTYAVSRGFWQALPGLIAHSCGCFNQEPARNPCTRVTALYKWYIFSLKIRCNISWPIAVLQIAHKIKWQCTLTRAPSAFWSCQSVRIYFRVQFAFDVKCEVNKEMHIPFESHNDGHHR